MKRIMTNSWNWFDRFYARFAKILLIVCLLAATGGVIIGTTAQINTSANAAADRTLVSCLNDWSAESAAVSKAVRTASEAKDVAVTHFNATLADEGDAFLSLVEAIVDPTTKPSEYDKLLQRLQRTLQIRSDANAAVITAQINLDAVREANPPPAPPAIFCDLEQRTMERTE